VDRQERRPNSLYADVRNHVPLIARKIPARAANALALSLMELKKSSQSKLIIDRLTD